MGYLSHEGSFQLDFCCYCKIVFCLFICSTNYFYFLLSDACKICKAVGGLYLCTVADRTSCQIKHVCECFMPFYLFRVTVLQFMKYIMSKSCFVPVFNIVLISHCKCELFFFSKAANIHKEII